MRNLIQNQTIAMNVALMVNDQVQWECPRCHNTNRDTLTVIRRTCGYLGENFWNEGRTKEIKDRVMHI